MVKIESDNLNNFSFVLGARADNHNRLGLFFTPRAHVKYNPFAPPERRYPDDIFVSPHINYPSRGYPNNFQILGILVKENIDEHPKDNIPIYNIYGRPTFPRSNEYDYFIEGVFNNMPIKIPIKNKKELIDGDILRIPELASISKNFKVKLYDYYQPRYTPYDINI
jgi:hypothetical protein